MVNISIDVTDLGGEARPGDKVVFWRPRMGGSATHAGRVISTAPVTVFLTDGKATVSDVEPGEMTVLLQCRGVESQGPVTVGVPDGDHTVTLRALLESQFEYAPPIVSAVQEAASNASASEEAAIQAQIRSEAAADRADAKVDDAINNGAALVRDKVKQDADRAVSARQAATQSESNAAASEGAAASSASNAAASETNAKQSETNAGDYAAVATTAATEAVDAMSSVTDIVGAKYATQEYVDDGLALKADKTYVDSATWLKPALSTSANVDTLPSGLHPVPAASVSASLGLPGVDAGELVTTWLDSGGLRRRQTYYTDRPTASAGMSIYRRWYYNGTWSPWALESQSSPSPLGTENLNNVIQNGTYIQTSTSAGTKARNYPVTGGGSTGPAILRVTAMSGFVEQILTEFRNGKIHFRGRNVSGTWNDWTTLPNQAVTDPEAPEVPEVPGLPVLDMEVTGKWTPNANGDEFLKELSAKHEMVTVEEIGRSRDNWPIYAAIIGDPTLPAVLVIAGQHGTEVGPPEGAWLWCRELTKQKSLALMDVCVIVVPMVNPDNRFIARGNKNVVDLNRDWLDFSQPETQAVRTVLDEYNVVAAVDAHNFGYPRDISLLESDKGSAETQSLATELYGVVEGALEQDSQSVRRYGPGMGETTFSNGVAALYEVPAVLLEIPCGGYGTWTFDFYNPSPSWQAHVAAVTFDAVLSHVAKNVTKYDREP